MKSRNMLLPLVLSLAFLSACAGGHSRAGVLNSFVAADYPASAETLVAADLAAGLAEVYPPGRTNLHLKSAGAKLDPFGETLENALRTRGFTLLPEASSKGATVAYVFDRLDKTSWYSRVSLSDGLIMTRVYRQAGDTLEAAAATRTGLEDANGPK